ncbi:Fc receptor-like protein 4 isoform X3 [Myxocyprinus asiaticus]|uniref:Fc receptor-like protein 4 isoform X3 n=1 Tax=Myxocyprinus asiaticus TaxID=70543 RepID=UPI002222EDA2|nr:Fc receptor-like protein 4 isoform X3 [Myxocyprinus asiaticus]
MESSVLPLILLLMSNSYSEHTPGSVVKADSETGGESNSQERPKPVLTVNPKTSQIFRGETVTLTCDIQGTEVTHWTYRLRCDGADVQDFYKKEFKITAMDSRYSCKCKCFAISTSRQFRSSFSDEVSFTVIERPKPEVTVNPDHHVFRGETVTLTCDIQRETHTEWRYSWFKDGHIHSYTSTPDLKIRSVYESDSGKYSCRGEKISDSQRSDISDAVTLTVSEIPKPVLTVNPKTSPIFRGETVTLTCDIQMTEVTHWTYGWQCDGADVQDFNEKEIKITATYSRYSCKCKCYAIRPSGQFTSYWSDEVSFTVIDSKLNPELTSDTAGAALTGNTVTLICHMTQTAGWDFYWYKHTQNSEKKKTETNSYRVHIDSVSDGGQYWCRAGRGEPVYYTNYSDALWVNVTVSHSSDQISVLHTLSSLLAVCPYLIVTVVLVFKCYRARVSSVEDQCQYAVTEEETSI